MMKQMAKMEHCISSIKGSPVKPLSPHRFLRKDSNLAGFVVWDVDGKVESMESQFKELQNIVKTTLVERKGHDDALELAKMRGTSLRSIRLSRLSPGNFC
jgi:hypothetical protein